MLGDPTPRALVTMMPRSRHMRESTISVPAASSWIHFSDFADANEIGLRPTQQNLGLARVERRLEAGPGEPDRGKLLAQLRTRAAPGNRNVRPTLRSVHARRGP